MVIYKKKVAAAQVGNQLEMSKNASNDEVGGSTFGTGLVVEPKTNEHLPPQDQLSNIVVEDVHEKEVF